MTIAAHASRTRPERIMHVDDEDDIRAVAKLSLESIGNFTVLSCESGEAALKHVSSFDPDLILLDVMMPGLSGPDVLAELKKVPDVHKVPVVFMTAKVQHGEVAHLMALGAAQVIEKPFDPVVLPERIADIWREHSQ